MASFGEELRRERELRDISLAEIAESTNIPKRFLEALEQNNFGILPGGAYNRGFIRSFARHIGVNVEEMVDAYHEELTRQESQAKRPQDGGAPPQAHKGSGAAAGAFIGAAVLLGAAVVGYVYWAASARKAPVTPAGASAHEVALKARVKKSGALPSALAAAPVSAPADSAPPPVKAAPAPGGEDRAEDGGLERLVRIRALETTWVQLTCARSVAFRGDLWVGSERHFACLEPMLVSAANGGAVEYSVGSSTLQLLGERGEVVRDRRIPLMPPATPEPGPAASQKTHPAAPAAVGQRIDRSL